MITFALNLESNDRIMALAKLRVNESIESELAEITMLTRAEGTALFESRAREWLGLSGDEFIHKWEAGEIEDPDRSDVVTLVLMIPMTR